jgi:hypothetical protein
VVAQQVLAMHKIKETFRLRLLGGITDTRRVGLAVGCGKSALAGREAFR